MKSSRCGTKAARMRKVPGDSDLAQTAQIGSRRHAVLFSFLVYIHIYIYSCSLYSSSKSLVLPLSFPIRACIPLQRFLFHRRRFSSLRLSSATLVIECFLWGSCRTGCGCSRFSHSSLPVILRRTLHVLPLSRSRDCQHKERMLQYL